jgi:hypothetical protein
MEIIKGFINDYNNIILLVIAILNIAMLMVIIINSTRLSKIKSKYKKLTNDIGNKNLEEIMSVYYSQVEKVLSKNSELEHRTNKIEKNIENCIQKIGIVRYNAFENVGSDLSFAVALLDSEENGVIINSIFSRENSSIYAKPIIQGKSKYTLSAEETQAIETARKTYNEKRII